MVCYWERYCGPGPDPHAGEIRNHRPIPVFPLQSLHASLGPLVSRAVTRWLVEDCLELCIGQMARHGLFSGIPPPKRVHLLGGGSPNRHFGPDRSGGSARPLPPPPAADLHHPGARELVYGGSGYWPGSGTFEGWRLGAGGSFARGAGSIGRSSTCHRMPVSLLADAAMSSCTSPSA